MRISLCILVGLSAISSGFVLSAATISTSASCRSYAGEQIVDSSSVATCSISTPDGGSASGTAVSGGAIHWPDYSITGQPAVEAYLVFVAPPPPSSYGVGGSVTAAYDDDLTFEISGGSGSGTVVPMLWLFAAVGHTSGLEGSWAEASFGPVKLSAYAPQGPDGNVFNAYPFSFVFGVPFTVHLHLESSAAGGAPPGLFWWGGGDSFARFDGLKDVRLANGEIVPNAVITQITTPEPSTLVLCITGIGFIWLERSRKRSRAH